ncbi:MAG: hypothetical protein J5734_01955 [Prevotella sp.]|nr:hypothetical protein [Prevotella sp.]
MKKVMTTLVLLLTTVVMSAQVTGVKIAPKYQKGDNKLYRTVGTMTVGGEIINVLSETRYVVTEANADGYVIETTLEKMDTDSKDLTGKVMQLMQGAMKGVKTAFTTDADGKITGIKNFDEVKENALKMVDELFQTISAELPDATSAALPIDMLKQQVGSRLTQETVIAQSATSPGPLSLNGKTISTGTMDESVDQNGRKVKNMYFLSAPDGSKVKATTTLNMTKEDMKKMIVDQLKSMMPDQVSMVEQNIDQIMDSGMLKMESTQTADYEFLPNGWLKSLRVEQKQETMGQTTEMNTKTELVVE